MGPRALARFRVVAAIHAGTQFLAGSEEGNALGVDHDLLARARIAPDARLSLPDRKGAEPSQFDTVAVGKRSRNLVEDDRDDFLKVVMLEMGIFIRQTGDQF